MKRGILGVVAPVALAVIMFLAGSLGPFRADGSKGAGAPSNGIEPAASSVAASDQQLDRTIASLQRSLAAGGRDWKLLAQLGLSYLTKGRLSADPTYYTKADTALRRSLALHARGNFQARLGLGILAAARHDFSAALRWAKQAKRINPFNADIRGVMTDALVELGRYRSATRALQKMVDLRPDLASYARISYVRELHGDVPGAIQAMSTGRDFAGGSGVDVAWASYQLGELYFNSGRPARAAREYRRGAHAAPGYVLPRAGLAKVAAVRGNIGEATDKLARVVERYPTPELVIMLGDLYAEAARTQEAGRQYDLVGAIQRLYAANGVNTDLEVALFDADHGLNPKRAVRRARSEYRRRRSVHVADALAWALYADGRYREARRWSRRALRLGTRSALFHFHAGMIALRLGDRSAARAHLEAVRDINPNFSFLYDDAARRTLRRLRRSST